MPWAFIGSSMMGPTFIRGSRLDCGSWKMICMSLRFERSSSALIAAMSSPLK